MASFNLIGRKIPLLVSMKFCNMEAFFVDTGDGSRYPIEIDAIYHYDDDLSFISTEISFLRYTVFRSKKLDIEDI